MKAIRKLIKNIICIIPMSILVVVVIVCFVIYFIGQFAGFILTTSKDFSNTLDKWVDV